jgi:hypothetical protein
MGRLKKFRYLDADSFHYHLSISMKTNVFKHEETA